MNTYTKRNLIFTGVLVALGFLAMILIPLFVGGNTESYRTVPTLTNQQMTDLEGSWTSRNSKFVIDVVVKNETVDVEMVSSYIPNDTPTTYWNGSFKTTDVSSSIITSYKSSKWMMSDSETKKFIYNINDDTLTFEYYDKITPIQVVLHRAS